MVRPIYVSPSIGAPLDIYAQEYADFLKAAAATKNSLGSTAPAIEDRENWVILAYNDGLDAGHNEPLVIHDVYEDPINDTVDTISGVAAEIALENDPRHPVFMRGGTEAGDMGQVKVGGITLCKVKVVHDSHDRVSFDAAGELHTSFHGNMQIAWKGAVEEGVANVLIQWPLSEWGEVKGVAAQTIQADGFGLVTVWKNGATTGAAVEAHLNWMHGDQDISTGKQVIIKWFPDEEKWIVTHAECEDSPPTP